MFILKSLVVAWLITTPHSGPDAGVLTFTPHGNMWDCQKAKTEAIRDGLRAKCVEDNPF